MAFSEQRLLSELPSDRVDCAVAYSGGLDSHVLLIALCQLRDAGKFSGKIRALHVHHGLSPNADLWLEHCRNICIQLNVPLETVKVDVNQATGSLENAARKARYKVFEESLSGGEVLLMAHHLDDQMETFLFRLLRGTGLKGLAGITAQRPLGKGSVLRPLLQVTRAELLDYATTLHQDWIDDESNADTGFDRNYLRHKILPAIESRWPGFRKNWQRTALLAAEGEQLQLELGMQDLAQVREQSHRLNIPALMQFSELRQRNILRSWCVSLEQEYGVPLPDFTSLMRVMTEVIPAAGDGNPLVSWSDDRQQVEIRRFHDDLYLVMAGQSPAAGTTLSWQPGQPLVLPGHLGTLTLVEVEESGIDMEGIESLEVAWKTAGEQAKPAGRKTRPLKKIFQDYDVPPWLRESIPLIRYNGSLVAVGDLFICADWLTLEGQGQAKKLHRIQWQRSDLHCGY